MISNLDSIIQVEQLLCTIMCTSGPSKLLDKGLRWTFERMLSENQ